MESTWDEALHPTVRGWFATRFPGPTPAQIGAVAAMVAREHVLVASPTGSGKTLAAFLTVLSDLHARAARGDLADATYCVYVSPLKALVDDVARNLARPLSEMAMRIQADGGDPPDIRVGIRTGDTPPSERARQSRLAPHILVTTPESLLRVLASAGPRAALTEVRWLIVDEVHALVEHKRGTHLAVSLEHVEALAITPPVRVGLSATVAPLRVAAGFLCGARTCRIVDAPPKTPPELDIALVTDPDELVARIAAIIERHATTIVFTGTRAATERLTSALSSVLETPEAHEEGASVDPRFAAPEAVPAVVPHHGSMSHAARVVVEERLKRQEVRCVVTSSSLELGVHVDGVEHVVLVGSPRSVARALQRAGRADHRVGGVSRATLFVTDADDLAEALALRERMLARDIEPLTLGRPAFDILVQQLVVLVACRSWTRRDLRALISRAAPFAHLTDEMFDAAVAIAAETGLLVEEGDVLSAAGGRSRMVVARQGGTIPSGNVVKAYATGRYVGALDETFAAGLTPGDHFVLSGETWRFVGTNVHHIRVAPAPGAAATVPSWRAEATGMSRHLASATQKRRHTANADINLAKHETPLMTSQWQRFVRQHCELVGRTEGVGVENVVTDDGRRAFVFHRTLGRRTHDALGRVIAHRLGRALNAEVRSVASDHGFAIIAPRGTRLSRSRLDALFADPLEPTLREILADTDLFRRRFRHVAFRALVLRDDMVPPPERQRAANGLLGRLRATRPDHPLLEETWREVLHDALDLDHAEAARAQIAWAEWPLTLLPTRPCASPYAARILVRHDDGFGGERAERLRDHDERVADWLEVEAIRTAADGGARPAAGRL